MSFLSVRGISKQWKEQLVLNSIDFDLDKGQKLAIAGETGSGKTSLLQIMGGRAQASSGRVLFKEKYVPGTDEKLIPGHPGIGYHSQHFELPPHYWVHELLEYANQMSETDKERLYHICRIQHLLSRRTNQLSGGERQRIALARELSSQPDLLLLDEPFSNLDAINKRIIKRVIQEISEQLGITLVLVSHEASDLLDWADEILILQKGLIVQRGQPFQLYQEPTTEYAAGLLGEYSMLNPFDSACASIPFAREKGKNWLVRPEDVLLAREQDLQCMARVERIEFRGHYYACQLLFGTQTITMYSQNPEFASGNTIGIHIRRVSFIGDKNGENSANNNFLTSLRS